MYEKEFWVWLWNKLKEGTDNPFVKIMWNMLIFPSIISIGIGVLFASPNIGLIVLLALFILGSLYSIYEGQMG